MITVMQGIRNVKLKSRGKAENVVRISEESLENTEPDGCLCKKEHNGRNKTHTNRSMGTPESVHPIDRLDQARTRRRSVHGSLWRTASSHAQPQRGRGQRVDRDLPRH